MSCRLQRFSTKLISLTHNIVAQCIQIVPKVQVLKKEKVHAFFFFPKALMILSTDS